MDKSKVGRFISELRKESQMTQAQLAENIHVTPQAISKWERGLGMPDIENIEALAVVFHVSLTEIVRGERFKEASINLEQVEEIMENTFELSKHERRMQKRTMLMGVGLTIGGVVMMLVGMYFYVYPRLWMMQTGDGATSVFMVEKVAKPYPIALIIAGGAVVLFVLRYLGKTRNQ